MDSQSALHRMSRKKHQVILWIGRLLFAISSTAFLLFLLGIVSHWLIASKINRVHHIESLLSQHIFWHVRIQQCIAQLYVRDFLFETGGDSENKKEALNRMNARYASPQQHAREALDVPLPEEYFLIKMKEFSSGYTDVIFWESLTRWQNTLKTILSDENFLSDLWENSGSNFYNSEETGESALKVKRKDKSTSRFSLWKARLDAVNAWKVSQNISGNEVESREVFLLRDWISDLALIDLEAVLFQTEVMGEELYIKWEIRHYEFLASLFIAILTAGGFWWLWWKKNDGQHLFDSPNSYFTDRLTGLFNRDHFNAIGTKLLKESQDKGFLLSVVTIQIHQFKQLNEVYGFAVGDKVLQYLAKKIRENLRATDQLSRVSGGEFAILLPKSSSEGVALFTKRLQASLDKLCVIGSYGENVKFTVLINEEACKSDDVVISDALKRAINII